MSRLNVNTVCSQFNRCLNFLHSELLNLLNSLIILQKFISSKYVPQFLEHQFAGKRILDCSITLWPVTEFSKVFKLHTPTECGSSVYRASVSLSLYLSQSHNYNWFWQVIWHTNYWWHHGKLSTRPNDSASLVISIKVSWLLPRTPEVCFEKYTWLTHLPQL